jgi:hypothetical protein
LNKFTIYHRFVLVTMLCFCCTMSATAQKLFTVTGVVFRKSTQDRVSQAIINNITRNTVTMSDELGTFRIQAAVGDSLLIKKVDFTTQTLAILNDNLLPVYLQPIMVLEEVKINELSKRQELSNTLDNYKRTGQFYTAHPSVGSVILSPVSGLYSLFGKSASQARRFERYTKEELEQQAISKRYSKELIKKITNMADSEIDAFILAFRPSYENIRIWSDYDIINYIKKSFDYYEKNKANMKSNKLY